jgi:phosphatidylserine/phosphatidylglycerophosphate/cardiolipin synthase-like enzyme
VALGQKCHLILANGAFKSGKPDENAEVRAQLRGKVDLHDRIVTGNHFAHNKFVVFCDSSGTPQSVLSGSTNWTKTGLCTQANNGIIVNDPALAADFVEEWKLLKDAGNLYPASLAQANSNLRSFKVDGATITQWFVPTSAAQDLVFARKLISAAQNGILFLFFNPGQFVADDQPLKWTLLQNILSRHHQGAADFNAGLYIRGVVNQEIANLTTEATADPKSHAVVDPATPANPVTLFSGGDNPPQRLRYDSMVPKNIKDTFHDWKTEVLGSGVHVHSKVIVLDPFGAHPVVMTGSHNLGFKASSVNDDNLMIIEGNAPLAAAYAANIIAIYQTYRWNAYVEAHRQDPQVWHGPVDNDSWQNGYLQGDELAEIKFWLGAPSAGVPPGAAPAPAGAPARSASATGPAPTQPAAGRPRPAAAKKAASTKAKPKKKAAAKKKATTKKKAAAKKKAPAKKKAQAKKKV